MTLALYSIYSALNRVYFCQHRCTLNSALNVSHNALCCSLTMLSVVACEKLDMMLNFSFSVSARSSAQKPVPNIVNTEWVWGFRHCFFASVISERTQNTHHIKWMSELHTLAPLTVTYLAYFWQLDCSLSFRLSYKRLQAGFRFLTLCVYLVLHQSGFLFYAVYISPCLNVHVCECVQVGSLACV